MAAKGYVLKIVTMVAGFGIMRTQQNSKVQFLGMNDLMFL
jgi:hypothetical protein